MFSPHHHRLAVAYGIENLLDEKPRSPDRQTLSFRGTHFCGIMKEARLLSRPEALDEPWEVLLWSMRLCCTISKGRLGGLNETDRG